MNWLELLQNLGIFAIISYFIKSLIKVYLDRDIEKFKTNLEKEAIAFRIKYEKLHLERAEIIKEIYKKIVRIRDSAEAYMRNTLNESYTKEKENEIKGKLENELNSLISYYKDNKFFFQERLAQNIDIFIKLVSSSITEFYYSRYNPNNKTGEGSTREWGEVLDALKNIGEEAFKIILLLEEEFRKIIGIESDDRTEILKKMKISGMLQKEGFK